MNKILIVIAILGLIAGGTAFASIDIPGCTSKSASNYNPSATIDNGTCQYPANGDPMLAVQPWGVNGYNTPIIKSGVKGCPIWFPFGCFDLSGIQNYAQKSVDWYCGFGSHFSSPLCVNR